MYGANQDGVKRESRREKELVNEVGLSALRKAPQTKAQKAAKRIVDNVVENGHILVTSYSGLQTYAEILIPVDWEYAVLDEGHQIRNPNAAITLFAKELRTARRLILSGTPMQNNLTELWSLFDFIFPMKLGNLLDFKNQFEVPLRLGSYANASNLQIQTATKCAETLKDAISPYHLKRLKIDVAADLPNKTEKVLFCRLTKPQREAYEVYLASPDGQSVLLGSRHVLSGIDILRKICNHPDLENHKILSKKPGYNYGSSSKSGKLVVCMDLIKLFKDTGHKTLLFAQHRIMLDILEKNIKRQSGINYRRMDGNTKIANRQAMVDEFNNNPEAHVFLLTTKVGGLGVNLTSADRVIIFDPDWNPSTDIQARERSWRLGQTRDVEIYRLMVAGTIEEKIYQRQIFKQHLTNKVMTDPKQRQAFQHQDLHDLFTLGTTDGGSTETSRLFKGSEIKFNERSIGKQSAVDEFVPWGGASPPRQAREEQDSERKRPSNNRGPMAKTIEDVEGIAAIEAFESDEDEYGEKTADDRIMETLFARAGVHSAIEHDQIVNGKRRVTADPDLIAKEATKIAKRAEAQLKRSEAVARSQDVGVVTWTGQYGSGGRPRAYGSRANRGGPSSSSVLGVLQGRLAEEDAAAGPSKPSRPLVYVNAEILREKAEKAFREKITRDLANLFRRHDGRIHTQNMSDHFGHVCTDNEKKTQFMSVLRLIATLERPSNSGRGVWVLKEEYKS